jgi:hypothetical protein
MSINIPNHTCLCWYTFLNMSSPPKKQCYPSKSSARVCSNLTRSNTSATCLLNITRSQNRQTNKRTRTSDCYRWFSSHFRSVSILSFYGLYVWGCKKIALEQLCPFFSKSLVLQIVTFNCVLNYYITSNLMHLLSYWMIIWGAYVKMIRIYTAQLIMYVIQYTCFWQVN